ncbi:MAG: hypothetical protein AAFV53_10485 [Myxococcota bacterium]
MLFPLLLACTVLTGPSPEAPPEPEETPAPMPPPEVTLAPLGVLTTAAEITPGKYRAFARHRTRVFHTRERVEDQTVSGDVVLEISDEQTFSLTYDSELIARSDVSRYASASGTHEKNTRRDTDTSTLRGTAKQTPEGTLLAVEGMTMSCATWTGEALPRPAVGCRIDGEPAAMVSAIAVPLGDEGKRYLILGEADGLTVRWRTDGKGRGDLEIE